MRINRISLKNFCQHVDGTWTLDKGFVGLIGRNGMGKSNLLMSPYAAITNDFRGWSGVKSDNVTFGAGPRAASYIEIEGEHAGTPFVVHRGVRSSTSWATIGDRKIDGDTQITDAMLKFLGVGEEILKTYVFVSQGAATDLLHMQKAKRVTALSKLFGVEKIEALHVFLRGKLNLLPETPATAETGPMRQQIVEQEAILKEAKSSLSQLQDQLRRHAAAYDQSVLEDSLRSHQDAETKQNRAKEIAYDIEQIERNSQSLVDQVKSLDALIAEVEWVRSRFDDFQLASKTIASAEESRRKIHHAEQIRKKLDGLTAPVAPYPEADILMGDAVDEGSREIAVLVSQIQQANTTISKFSGDPPTCPTCGYSAAELVRRVTGEREKLAKLTQRKNYLEPLVSRSIEYRRSMERYNRESSEYSIAKDSLERELVDFSIDQIAIDRYDEAKAFVDNFQKCSKRLEELTKSRQSAAAVLEERNASLLKMRATLDIFGDYLSKLLTPDLWLSKKQALDEFSRLNTEIFRASSKVDSIESMIASATRRIESIEASNRDGHKLVAWRQAVDKVVYATHRDQIQKQILSHYLIEIEGLINNLLSACGAPFHVSTIMDEMTFQANFDDGKSVVATRLSGGQQVLLALAFIISVNSVFSADVGSLWLDEPTQFLDSVAVDSLANAFEALRRIAAGGNLQMVFATHESKLHRMFDCAVML